MEVSSKARPSVLPLWSVNSACSSKVAAFCLAETLSLKNADNSFFADNSAFVRAALIRLRLLVKNVASPCNKTERKVPS